MTLETLEKDLVYAIKTNKPVTRDVLRSIVGSIKKYAIDKGIKGQIAEPIINELILREKRILQEMIDTCPADRIETLELYQKKKGIVNYYAPKLITNDEEVKTFILDIVKGEIDLIKSNRGKIMKVIAPAAKGKVDMAVVNRVLETILE